MHHSTPCPDYAQSRAYDRLLAAEASGERHQDAAEKATRTPYLTTEFLNQHCDQMGAVVLHPAFGYRRVIGSDTDDTLRESLRTMPVPGLVAVMFRHPHWAEAVVELLRDQFVTEYDVAIQRIAERMEG